MGDVITIIGFTFIGIVILLIIGVPVAFTFGVGTIVLIYFNNIDPGFVVSGGFKMLQSFVFLAFPLYIFLGSIVSRSGIADRLSSWFVSIIGRVKGGLGVALILTNGVFGAMSGSAAAALAGISKAFITPMEKEGYPKDYVVSLLIPSSVLSLFIPPSSLMILFGFLTNLPISLVFLAPAIPGLILIVLLSVIHLFMCRRIPTINVPPRVPIRKQFGTIANSTYNSFLGLLLPILILGSIYGGIATPTESAAIGALYAFLIGLICYRTIHIKDTYGILSDTAKITGSIVILLFFFTALSKILIMADVTEVLINILVGISNNKYIIMLMLNVILLLFGMFMDDGSAMMMAAIFLTPIATEIGFDPFHFAAIACVNLSFGLISPPVALLLYLGGRTAGLPLKSYIKKTMIISFGAFLPTLLLTIFIPELSVTLPGASPSW